MTGPTSMSETPRCAHAYCGQPLEVKATGRPARFCSPSCRKADHRLATAARAARASLPRLRRYLDEALTETERAINRLHISGLSEAETGGLKPERQDEVDYAVARGLERLRSAARERRDALATAARHPAGASGQHEEDDD